MNDKHKYIYKVNFLQEYNKFLFTFGFLSIFLLNFSF